MPDLRINKRLEAHACGISTETMRAFARRCMHADAHAQRGAAVRVTTCFLLAAPAYTDLGVQPVVSLPRPKQNAIMRRVCCCLKPANNTS